jgi:hypothetical protein
MSMRLAGSCFLMFALVITLAGVSGAQDTNFGEGPQYLITDGFTPLFHPIATPSLSLNTAPQDPYLVNLDGSASTELVAAHPDFPSADLKQIFWGRPEASENAVEIEIVSSEVPPNLPPSILDDGVTAVADTQSLHDQGYGVTAAEAAAFWKTHAAHAPHVYTNADVDRLHGN